MPPLPDAFRHLAEARLRETPALAYVWKTEGERSTLTLPSNTDTGFEVRVECESYGLYVYADGWHGAPFEVGPVTSTESETAENCLGFVRTLLSPDSSLTIHFAGGRPFKWVLSYATEMGVEREETGLLVFNYLGRRTERKLQNRQLPARYVNSAA